MLFFLLSFITITFAGYSPPIPPLPCPSTEDIKIAWYSGGTCSQKYSCCFDEQVEKSDGNFTLMSCCYAYGNDGPYKCCGRDLNEGSPAIFLLFLLPASPGIFLVFYFAVKLCCMLKTKPPTPKPNQTLESDTDVQLETIISESFETLED